MTMAGGGRAADPQVMRRAIVAACLWSGMCVAGQSRAEEHAPVLEAAPASVPAPSAPMPSTLPAENGAATQLEAASAPARKAWYGDQTLAVDVLSNTLLLIGLLECYEGACSGLASAIGAVGGLGYLLGTPSIHLVHGNWGRALGSVAMRVVSPVVIPILGILLPMSIDSAYLAYEEVPGARAGAQEVVPIASFDARGVRLSFGGAF